MPVPAPRVALALAAFVACDPAPTSPSDPAGSVPLTITPPKDGLLPCSPPLAIAPGVGYAVPHGRSQFHPSGGTGAYEFSLAAGAVGSIEDDLGVYLAGAESGAADEVVLVDAGCAGEARAAVYTVDPLTVAPETLTVLPGTVFTPEIHGGTGSVTCGLADGAVGALDGCTYTAGGAGLDVLTVTDLAIDAAVEVVVIVDPAAAWEVAGDEAWFVPVGATFAPTIRGGSGIFDLVPHDPSIFGPADGGLLALAAGSTRVDVVDRFAGFATTVTATAIAPVAPPSVRFGLRSNSSAASWAGDLDGDGYDDAVVAFYELSVNATQDGAVMVYRGGPTGFEPDPVQVFPGWSRSEISGRALLVEDLDGDGLRDLVIGADGADEGYGDQGAVRIHPGVPGGWFSALPSAVLTGDWYSDRFGISVDACDLNGDGLLDLIVGAYGAEDRSFVGYPYDIGGAFWYLNDGGGWPAEPSGTRWGVVPDGVGGWIGTSATNFGLFGLAAGDLDGDGRCDLALGAPNWRLGGVNGQGTVVVFGGDDDTTFSTDPVALIANLEATDTNGNFGRGLQAADLDGDGADELIVAHPFADAAGINDRGAVRVFAGGPFPDDALAPIPATSADWTWLSTESSEYTSLAGAIQAEDVDGDGLADLAFGVANGDGPVASDGFGVAYLYDGASIVLDGRDATSEPPWVALAGDQAGGFFGQAVAFVPDLGSDGLPDAIVLAGRHDELGIDVGLALSATSDAAPTHLALPGAASGHEHGRGLAWFDTDGDGVTELVIGSPGDTWGTAGGNTGSVTAFDVGATVGTTVGGGIANHGGGDTRGYLVSDVGDFDGDGASDLAIVSRSDSTPTTFDAQYANPTACPGVSGQNGGVGSVAIHRGGPAGVAAAPTFVWYGPVLNGNVRALAGRFDYNGDGYGDIVVGSRLWYPSSQGGAAIVYGRAPPAAGIQVICPTEAELYYGEQLNAYFGDSVAALGDLDGDGCDEVAVGAPYEDVLVGVSLVGNVGVVRVFFGHGPSCATTTQRVAVASSEISSASAGFSLAGGADFDGDGLSELAVGGPNLRVVGSEVGAAWVVPGSHLADLPQVTVPVGVLVGTAAHRGTLVPFDGGVYGVFGGAGLGKFGEAVEVGVDGGGAAWVAVGAYDGDVGGVPLSGGVSLYRWGADGLRQIPFAVIGGEGHLLGGDLGDTLNFGITADGPALAVGAPLSSQLGVQTGAAYLVPVGSP